MKICLLITSLLLPGLTGCDCYVAVKGKVLSSSMGEPINGATIIMVDRNIETTSDEKGHFLLDELTGFCYDPRIVITKTGYKPFHLNIKSDAESISYQVKKGSESIDFEEPVYSDSSKKDTFITATWLDQFSQNFEVKDDSIIFYLDENNPEKEIKLIQERLRNSNSLPN